MVIGLFRTLNLIGMIVGFVQLLLALALAVVMRCLGLSVFGPMTKELVEWGEPKKGNDGVGKVMAAGVTAISAIVSQGVSSINAAIFA